MINIMIDKCGDIKYGHNIRHCWYKRGLGDDIVDFSVSLVVEWQIPILLARVRFPDGE